MLLYERKPHLPKVVNKQVHVERDMKKDADQKDADNEENFEIGKIKQKLGNAAEFATPLLFLASTRIWSKCPRKQL